MSQYSPAATKLKIDFEGKAAYPYLCPAGVVTTAIGHVVKPGEEKRFLGGKSIAEAKLLLQPKTIQAYWKTLKPLSEAEMLKILEADIASHSAPVDERLKKWGAKVDENLRAGLIDLAFNVGPGALDGGIKEALLKGDNIGAALFLPQYCKATVKGKRVSLAGLTFRRYSFVWLALAGEAWRIGGETNSDRDWAEVALFLNKLTALLKAKGRANPLPYAGNRREAQYRG